MSGWIKLHRNLIDWEWYTDHNTTRLFVHCVVRANFEPKNWRGISIERGQFWTSIPTLCAETGLSTSQIRTSLNKLKLTGELTVKSQAQGRMITIVEYNQYQADDRQADSPVAGESQTSDRPVTANKNLRTKELKKETNNLDDSEFENVWIAYGKKGNRKTSKAKFLKLSDAKREALTNHIPDYVFSTPEKQYRKNLETYINQECWNDEVIPNAENQPGKNAEGYRLSAVERVAAATEKNRAARAGNRDNLENADRDLWERTGESIRGSDAGGMDSALEGDYTVTDISGSGQDQGSQEQLHD